MLPAIIFLVACFLAFATGTSWGTFGILIPIVVHVFENTPGDLMIISISACMLVLFAVTIVLRFRIRLLWPPRELSVIM